MDESFNPKNRIPKVADRLVKLLSNFHEAAEILSNLGNDCSYIPIWEPLYSEIHGMKGLTRILECTDDLREIIESLCKVLLMPLSGRESIRDYSSTSRILMELSRLPELRGAICLVDKLQKSYVIEASHEERLEKIGPLNFSADALTTKKIIEAKKLQLNQVEVSELVNLDALSNWQKSIWNSLVEAEGQKGFVVAFVPSIDPDEISKLNAWSWLASASKYHTGLENRVRELLPDADVKRIS